MDLAGFVLAVLLIELTPGPNMAWLAGLGATEGRRVGLAAVAGVALGLLANGALAAVRLAALLQAAPQWQHGLQLAGAAMMAVLAVEAWIGASRFPATQSPTSDHRRRRAFLTGMMINLLNPKAYLFFVVVAPRFLGGAAVQIGAALLMALISAAIATAIHVGIVIAGSRAHAWLADPRATRTVRRLFAVVMMMVAASFLLADMG